MSKKIGGVTVSFSEDVSEEYAERVIQAIMLIDGVAEAAVIETSASDYLARTKIRYELRSKFIDFLKNEFI